MSELVTRLAARGDGVTETGVFVSGGVPGDHLSASGDVIPGPNRIAPVCRHFGRCGGCQLQHVTDTVFADYMVDRIAEALKAQGLPLADILTPHLSPPHSRRRASLRAMKMGKRVIIGYAESKSHQLVDLAECPVLHPHLFAVIAPLRLLLGQVLREKRPSDVRMTLTDQGVDLKIAGVKVEGLAATEALTEFAQAQQLARLSIDEGFGSEPRWEPAPVTVTLSGIAVSLPEGAFLQATADGEQTLVSAVQNAIGAQGGPIADLFAGLGTFTFSTQRAVLAVEGARDAAFALQGAAHRTQSPITVEHRDLFRRPLSTKELSRFEAIIIDPPRAGAKEQIAEIAVSSVPALASISCNPATFARDARALVDGGYRLNWIQPVGQFRWSTHVELAAQFSR